MPHEVYMFGLMLVVFAIGFFVIAAPMYDVKTVFALCFLTPSIATFLDLKLIPHSFWNGPGGAGQGWGIYLIITAVSLTVGWFWRDNFVQIPPKRERG